MRRPTFLRKQELLLLHTIIIKKLTVRLFLVYAATLCASTQTYLSSTILNHVKNLVCTKKLLSDVGGNDASVVKGNGTKPLHAVELLTHL